MKIMNQNREYLKSISEQGITFYVTYEGLGTIELHYCDIEDYLLDKDAFMAKSYGVSKDLFLAWLEFQMNNCSICMGKTKTGKRCKGYAEDGRKVNHPNLYIKSNPDLYCYHHKWQAREN